MPRHDLVCDRCGQVDLDVYCPLVPLVEPTTRDGYRVTSEVAFPAHCGQRMTMIPPRVAVDLAFQPFTTEIRQPDGSYRPTTVSSLRQIRQLETQTEQAARNGEGEALRWRDYSMDRSNRDVHTFGPDPAPVLSESAKRRFGAGLRKSVEAPEAALGPGVTEATVSALPDV